MKAKMWKTGLLMAGVLLVLGLLLTCGEVTVDVGGGAVGDGVTQQGGAEYDSDAVISSVTITGSFVQEGGTLQLTALVVGEGNYSPNVIWSCPEIENGDTTHTTLHPVSGLLTVGMGEEMVGESIEVVATSPHYDAEKNPLGKGTKIIQIRSEAQMPKITNITITPASVTAVAGGGPHTLTANVTGTNITAQMQDVTWSIVQEDKAADTTIDQHGVLTVSINEVYETLTVEATSTVDTSKKKAVPVTVTFMKVNLSATSTAVTKGQTQQFSASFANASGTITGWSIKEAVVAGTSISSSGLLTVAVGETRTSITVVATSNIPTSDGNYLSGEIIVLLYSTPPTVDNNGVVVSPATVTVEQGRTQLFTAAVTGTNDPPQGVTWSVTTVGKHANTTINSAGLLTVAADETVSLLTVQANSTLTGYTGINGTATVTVQQRQAAASRPKIDTPTLSEMSGSGVNYVVIDTGYEYQEMHGFGASDCWSGNFVGQWGPATNSGFPRFPYNTTYTLNWSPPTGWDAARVQQEKDQIADWLFSQEFDSQGNPKGIGLSEWRVNLGGGSLEQALIGENSKIGTVNRNNMTNSQGGWERNAECFLANIKQPWVGTQTTARPSSSTRSLNYDWTKQAGQQYWMREARKRGLEKMVAFSNSPLVPFTLSGTANNVATGSSTPGSDGKYTKLNDTGNLAGTHFASFAEYLADVANYFAAPAQNVTDPYLGRSISMRFNYISPVNEPQWEWNEDKQEGSRWTNDNIALLVKNIDTAIQASSRANINTDNTKQLIAEAARWDYITGNGDGLYNQINRFFNPSSSAYVGNVASMKPWKMGAHTYFTHGSDSEAVSFRDAVKSSAAGRAHVDNNNKPVDIWSTEFCGLGGGSGLSNVNSYFDFALFTAKLAHQDITRANARTFSFWTALDMEKGGQSKYSLIAYSPGQATYTTFANNSSSTYYPALTRAGAVRSQATLWAMGHYSLFVRPGFLRIKIDGKPNASAPAMLNRGAVDNDYVTNYMATAYKSPPGYTDFTTGRAVDRVVIVYVNMANNPVPSVGASIDGDRKPYDIRVFMTNANNVNGGTSTSASAEANKNGMRYIPQATNLDNIIAGAEHDRGIYTIPARSMVTVVYDFDANTL